MLKVIHMFEQNIDYDISNQQVWEVLSITIH